MPVVTRSEYVTIIWINKTILFLWKFVCPGILLVGTVANLLTVVLMRRKNMRRLPVANFLVALAISDTVTLYTNLLRNWFMMSLHIFIDRTRITCKVIFWVMKIARNYSIWLIVVITVDRLLSIFFPMFSKSNSRMSNVLKLFVPLGLIMAIYSHVLYGFTYFVYVDNRNVTRSACQPIYRSYSNFLYIQWPLIEFLVSSLLPFALVLTSNVAIIWKLKTRRRKNLTEGQSSERNRDSKKTVSARFIITLNIVLLLTTLPICLFIIIGNYVPNDYHGSTLRYYIIRLIGTLSYMLMYTGNSVNFFLYIISGRLIRKEFLSIFQSKETSQQIGAE